MIAFDLYNPDSHLSFNPFTTLLFVILAIGFILMLATAGRHRRHSAETSTRMCPGCSTPNPSHAGFCRNCGRKW